jgi:hypothetical protein
MNELSVFEQRLTASLEAYAGSRPAVDGLGIARSAAARAGNSTPVLVRLIRRLAPRGRWPAAVTMRLAILVVAATVLLLGLGFAVGSGLMRLPSVVQPAPSTVVLPPSSPSPQASRGSGTWTVTGKMKFGRHAETATLLPNGEVLVAGGGGGRDLVAAASAELYDPLTGRWTETGSMQTPRGLGHTATLLPDGRVLVAGGNLAEVEITSGHPPQRSAELYDPATGRWTETGSMALARSYHSATLLFDGKVLVVGGYRDSKSAELYDPIEGTWTATGSMVAARAVPSAALLPDGTVLVVGASDSDVPGTQSAELYDPRVGTWTPASSFAGVGGCRIARSLSDGDVLVVCAEANGAQTSAVVYHSATGAWATTASPPKTCCVGEAGPGGSITRLPDGRVLWKDLVDAGLLYDPATGSWASAGGPTYPADPSWGLPYTVTDEGSGYKADTLTLLPDGRVLMTTLGAGLLYDPNGGQ